MRNLFFPALVLIAVLLVAVGALVFWPDSLWPGWHQSLRSFLLPAAAPKVADVPAKTPEKGPVAKKPPALGRTVVSGETASPVAALSPTPGVAAAVAQRQYPFPVAEQITPGMPIATLVDRFGRPEMKVTGAEKTELRERYVYVDHATGRRTFVSLVNSVVTSAQTLTQ